MTTKDEHEYRHKWLDTVEQMAAERAEHREEIKSLCAESARLRDALRQVEKVVEKFLTMGGGA